MKIGGIEIWVWKGGKAKDDKRYMCWTCEQLFADPAQCQAHIDKCADAAPPRSAAGFLQPVVKA